MATPALPDRLKLKESNCLHRRSGPIIPKHVDIGSLSSFLGDATVVIDDDFPLSESIDPATLESEVSATVAAEPSISNLKLALIPGEDISTADLRDVAQGIKDATDANTVIVHSPDKSAVVADHFSRFAIETHTSVLANPASADGAEQVAQSTAQFSELATADQPPALTITGLILGGAVACVALGAAVTAKIAATVRRAATEEAVNTTTMPDKVTHQQ